MSVVTVWGLKYRNIITNLEIRCKIMCSTWIFSPKISHLPPGREKLLYQCFLLPFLFSFHLHSPTNPHLCLVSKCLQKSDSLTCLNHAHTEPQMTMMGSRTFECHGKSVCKFGERALYMKYLGIHRHGRSYASEGSKKALRTVFLPKQRLYSL